MNTYVKLPKKLNDRLTKQFGKSLRIGQFDYKLIFAKTIIDDGNSVEGLCCSKTKVIYITHNQDPKYLQATIIHEIGHAFCAEHGFRQMGDWAVAVEEIFVETLSQTLTTLFKLTRQP